MTTCLKVKQKPYSVILVGDTSVGKTNLVQRFTKSNLVDYTNNTITPTIGVQFSTRIIELQNRKRIQAQIWDTTGQELYRSIITMHYRRALGALVVYDITKQKTFHNVKRWIEQIRELAGPNIVIFLVGNKIDQMDQEQVNPADARKFANNEQIFFEETSALTNFNAEETLQKLIECTMIQIEKSINQSHRNRSEIMRFLKDANANAETQTDLSFCSRFIYALWKSIYWFHLSNYDDSIIITYAQLQLIIFQLSNKLMYPHSLKGISKQIQSQISQNQTKGIRIPKSTLQKYLHVGNHKCEQAIQKAIKLIIPVWSISLTQFFTNTKGVFTSNWPFSQNNRSIYFAIWGPISLILFSHLLHNDPYNSRFAVLQAGTINLVLIIILSYFGYIMSNVVNFQHCQFFQHVCISSHINLITLIFCCVCFGSSSVVIVLMSVAYIVLATYLHFNLYKQAFNTSIPYLAVILIMMAGLYISATFLFYHIFTRQFPQQSWSSIYSDEISQRTKTYQFLRQFSE